MGNRNAWPRMNRITTSVIALTAGVVILAGTAVAAAGDMSVATFLAKADALKAKGPLALMSSDIGLLREEGQAAGQAYRAQLDSERKAGHPSSCPPKGVRVTSDDLMGQMRAYPAARRPQITVKTAMADMFRAKFACPK